MTLPTTHIEPAPSATPGPATRTPKSAGGRFRARWPSLLGLAVAVLLLATGVADRDTLAIGVSAAAVCYLAAAAFGRPWVGWATIAGASLVVVGSELIGIPWWAGLGAAAGTLCIVGVARGDQRATLMQAVHVLGYGGVAVAAFSLAPRASLVVAGLALAAHAVWDVIHYRRNTVVHRSLSEACFLFDIVLGLGCILLAFIP